MRGNPVGEYKFGDQSEKNLVNRRAVAVMMGLFAKTDTKIERKDQAIVNGFGKAVSFYLAGRCATRYILHRQIDSS